MTPSLPRETAIKCNCNYDSNYVMPYYLLEEKQEEQVFREGPKNPAAGISRAAVS